MAKNCGYEGVPSPDEKSDLGSGGKITGTGIGGAKKSGSPFTSPYDPTPSPSGEKAGNGGKSPSGTSSAVQSVR